MNVHWKQGWIGERRWNKDQRKRDPYNRLLGKVLKRWDDVAIYYWCVLIESIRECVPSISLSINVLSNQYSCGKSRSRIQTCACVRCWEYLLKSLDQQESRNRPGFKLTVPIARDVRTSSSEENENSQNPRPRGVKCEGPFVIHCFESFTNISVAVYGLSPLFKKSQSCMWCLHFSNPLKYTSSVILIDRSSPQIVGLGNGVVVVSACDNTCTIDRCCGWSLGVAWWRVNSREWISHLLTWNTLSDGVVFF